MACPVLLVNDETVWARGDDAAADGNVREAEEAAGENGPALTSESARALAAADGRALVLAGGVLACAV